MHGQRFCQIVEQPGKELMVGVCYGYSASGSPRWTRGSIGCGSDCCSRILLKIHKFQTKPYIPAGMPSLVLVMRAYRAGRWDEFSAEDASEKSAPRRQMLLCRRCDGRYSVFCPARPDCIGGVGHAGAVPRWLWRSPCDAGSPSPARRCGGDSIVCAITLANVSGLWYRM